MATTIGAVADGTAGAAGSLEERADEVGEAVSAEVEGAMAAAVPLLKNSGAPHRAAMVPTVKLRCVTVWTLAKPDAALAAVKEVTVGTPPMLEGPT